MLHKERMAWFRQNVEPKLKYKYDLSFVSENDGDLGGLEGVSFDSPARGGYIYFWSSGYIGYELIDYESSKDIMPDTLVEAPHNKPADEILKNLLDHLL